MPQFLRAESLSKDFGGVRAIADLSMSLEESQMLCIIGPNGCGKTTLFNLISGSLLPTSGRVYFLGREITGLPPYQISRLGIGRKFQVPGIYPELTVFENIEVPLISATGQCRISGVLRRRSVFDEARRILEDVALLEKAGTVAGALSHGEKQWLEVGMVLASRPCLMLLDEPTAGMTFAETQATVELIRRIARATGVSFIIIEHDVGFVRELDCPIMVMMKGAILCQGRYDEIRQNTVVREAYLGRRA